MMHDDTNPTRPRPITAPAVSPDTAYALVLAGFVIGLVIIGAVLSPLIRGGLLLLILAYVGFFLAYAISAFLGYSEIPVEAPRVALWVFILVVGAGLITFTALFGLGLLIGFLVYVASVVGILVLMERRRRIEGPNTF